MALYAYDVIEIRVPTALNGLCVVRYPIRKTSSSAYGPLINPSPSLRKISYKYKGSGWEG